MSRSPNWTYIRLPAIAEEQAAYRLSEPFDCYIRASGEALHPARNPLWVLENERLSQGSLIFEAQYQQNPIPPGGNLIRRSSLKWFDESPPLKDFTGIFTSWDTASTLSETADFSVGTVWGLHGHDFYLLDLVRGRWEMPDLREQILDLDERFPDGSIFIEETELGRALYQELRRTTSLRPHLGRPRFDKVSRLLTQVPRFEAGEVYLPRDAPWIGSYVEELLAFPNGSHDDQVDSTSQALYILTRYRARLYLKRDPRRDRPRRDPVRR